MSFFHSVVTFAFPTIFNFFLWLYCFIRISCTLMSFLHSVVMFAFRTILNVFSRCIFSLESRALLGFPSFDCYFSISPTFMILFHNVTYLCQVLVSTNRGRLWRIYTGHGWWRGTSRLFQLSLLNQFSPTHSLHKMVCSFSFQLKKNPSSEMGYCFWKIISTILCRVHLQ